MKFKSLEKLLSLLNIQIIDYNQTWVRVSCPLAFLTHDKGIDERPSCSISINDKGLSYVNCFTCGCRSLYEVLHALFWTKNISREILEFYVKSEFIQEEAEDTILFNDGFSNNHKPEKYIPVPDEVLALFEPINKAADYLKSRKINLDIARQAGLQFWKNALLCPIRDTDFKTYWIHFRSINSKIFWHGKPEHFNSNIQWGRPDSWFGIEFLNINEPIVLVEGIMDCLRLKTLGLQNVIASHGGIGKKSLKLKRILDFNPKLLYLGFDADNAGKQFSLAVRRQANCKVIDLDWSKVGRKDPGELGSKEELEQVLDQQTLNFKFTDKFRRENYESF